MVDYDTANARLTSLTTFMGGLSVIILLLSINIMAGKNGQLTVSLFVVESANVILLLASMLLFFTSAATLASAYFEAGVRVDVGVKRVRRLLVTGVMLTFWSLSALLLVAFDFTAQAVLYFLVAAIAPVVFFFVRTRQGIAL